ncbi:MAG: helix-turn-helix domain-containing protein [Shimia sp.]|nr:helix-turn-helix domain-containing protein [Shimia sp.]
MQPQQVSPKIPTWLPQSVARYVAHTEQGVSIRELARRDGCHASTVMRQIRKLEAMRDDPVVDSALRKFRSDALAEPGCAPDMCFQEDMPDEDRIRAEGVRVLRRLCETGSVLAVANDMDTAVVMRDEVTRTATVSRQVAQAFVLKGWIVCVQAGRISRYAISPTGRPALSRLVAAAENQAQQKAIGFAEVQAGFSPRDARTTAPTTSAHELARRGRFMAAESPLSILARRRDKSGNAFLEDSLVAAGERLREDYELSQMGQGQSEWSRYLSAPHRQIYASDPKNLKGAEAARTRVVAALDCLGEGLSDVVLRCCCQLEGLEAAEKHLGWSARSGKVVLRIALMHLRDHYEGEAGSAGDYIG